MTSKPNAVLMPSPAWMHLSHEVLAVEGPGAADFLQRQCMNDLQALDLDGRWQWNGLLSPKGRVLGLFALLRCSPTLFWIVLPDGDAAGWAATLQRFVFRAKLRLQPLPAVRAIGLIGASVQATLTAPSLALPLADGWLLDHGSPGRARLLWLGGPVPETLVAEREQAIEAAPWTLENIRHGLPRITPLNRDRYTPQMLGLDRLAAFSVKKGCYPGQEIVARTHFLGQAKRRLGRIEADRPLLDDERLSCDGQETRILDQASFANYHSGLAVMPIESVDVQWRLDDGRQVESVGFIDGLARRSDAVQPP